MNKLKILAIVLVLSLLATGMVFVLDMKSEYTGTVERVYEVQLRGTTEYRCDQLKRKLNVRMSFNDAVNYAKGDMITVRLSKQEIR